MIDKLQLKIKNLELLLKVKSLILRATDIEILLQEVCKLVIVQNVYDVSWAMLFNQEGEVDKIISSVENNHVITTHLCWDETLKSSEVNIHPRDTKRCRNCVLAENKNSSLVSKRLEHDGHIFGVFSVSVKGSIIDKELELQFEELVDDIAVAINTLKLKETSVKYQNDLVEGQNMFKKLLETSSVAMGVIGLDYGVKFMTNSLLDMLGFPADINFKENKLKALDYMAEGLEDMAASALKEMTSDIPMITKDTIFKTNGGRKIKMRINISMLFDLHKKHSGFMVVFNDLSAQVKSAEALEYSEEQFRLLFMKAPNGVLLLNPAGVIIDCNEEEAEMLQLDRHEIIGTPVQNFLTSEFQEIFTDSFNRFLEQGATEVMVKLKRADNEEIMVLRNVSAIYDSEGVMGGIIVHSRDVTEKIKAQHHIKLLSSAIEQSSSIITITDLDGIITYVNNKFYEVTGYTEKEVLGKNPRILKSGVVSDDIYKDLWVTVKERGLWKGELCNKHKDGSLYWEFASITALRNDEGEITNLLKVAEDISFRKKAEQELEESNLRYQNIFNLAPSPILIHIDGVVVDTNDAAYAFSKIENKKDLIGVNVLQFIHESSRKAMIRRIEKLKLTGEEQPVIEAVFLNTKGEERIVRSVSRVVSFKGRRANMVVFEDVTDFRNAEKKVIASEKKFKDIFNLHPDPVSISGLETGVLFEANDAFLNVLGLNREDVIGVSSMDVNLYKSKKDRDEIVAIIKQQGYLLNHEVSFQLKDKAVTTLVSGTMFGPEENGKVLFVARDISTRKMMEQELVEAKEKAEKGERLKELFLSNMSHEIRTPMNAILGFSDLLRDSSIQPDRRNQYIDIIQQRGSDLLNMISNIMDISKIESHSLDLKMRAVKIKDLALEAIELAQLQMGDNANNGVELTYRFDLDNDVLVNGDKYRIGQVLNALIDNAIKFTKQGSISLRCWQEGEQVQFEIIDTGIGIQEDKLLHVFDPFVQVFDTKEISSSGAGLGLSLSKSLLYLMGSDIKIESALGRGVKVRFALNIYDGSEVQLSLPKLDNEPVKDWLGKTILVAEDEPSNQMYIKVILAKTKVKLIMANDGLEAVELYEKHKERISLVLLDVKMPNMNGYEVTKIIKEADPAIPVVVLTANAMNNDREEAMKAGCDDYLTKPISKKALFKSLEKYMM